MLRVLAENFYIKKFCIIRENNGKGLSGKLQRTNCDMRKHDLSTHIDIKKERVDKKKT